MFVYIALRRACFGESEKTYIGGDARYIRPWTISNDKVKDPGVCVYTLCALCMLVWLYGNILGLSLQGSKYPSFFLLTIYQPIFDISVIPQSVPTYIRPIHYLPIWVVRCLKMQTVESSLKMPPGRVCPARLLFFSGLCFIN